MDIKKLLLPYNFTNLDKKALDFVSQIFPNVKDVELTIFNIYTPVPSIDMKDSQIMKKMQQNLSYLSQLISEQEQNLAKAKQLLVSTGFPESHVKIVFKSKKTDVASHIIEIATEEKFDVIIINRKPGKVSRFFSGSVSNKFVTSLKNTIVCIVS
jgi:nucleotide-binding universal stress UspA family protein